VAAEARFDDQLLAMVGFVELEEEYALAPVSVGGTEGSRSVATEERS
jgi:hypothetical protein